MFSSLRWVRKWLEVVFLFLFITIFFFVSLQRLFFELVMSMVFNEKSDDVLISVTGRPEERIPAILLTIDFCAYSDSILGSLEIICMHSLHQHSIHLLCGQLLLGILFLRVVFIVTVVLCVSHLILSFTVLFKLFELFL